MRRALAPSASRTASSRCRSVLRASSRLATFAHATSSSRNDATCQTAMKGPEPWSPKPSVNDRTLTSRLACVSGYAFFC